MAIIELLWTIEKYSEKFNLADNCKCLISKTYPKVIKYAIFSSAKFISTSVKEYYVHSE